MSVPYTCKEAEQAILNTAELEYCEFLEDLTLETETPGTTRDKCLKRYGLIFCMKLIKTGEKKGETILMQRVQELLFLVVLRSTNPSELVIARGSSTSGNCARAKQRQAVLERLACDFHAFYLPETRTRPEKPLERNEFLLVLSFVVDWAQNTN